MDEFKLGAKLHYLEQLVKLVNADFLNGMGRARLLDKIDVVCNSIEEDLCLIDISQ
ncbi:hypothetical protein M5X00_14765 [Paenibacillus alvei]|uniref:hypothetical protein n=1 Tax=Paenibacillus alvei TaxID=44250 RepID=UPI00028952F8|nr:hypothetical protein [Paenibacillus alvei]EJW20037.1 hypothetical protein PAV_1c10320 [Paenibacillus alvei DSM 29]MCY9543376.1 hypothetical protein [Paenibacillus alvei]MCY9704744.1 hypothetical protein [Paenibacillus alvei]MCY9733703.1 hypothetical protein [Paenibacillus alvei]MCY9755506.1 hypothetical protein [Paenibacillus alvei]